MEKGRKELLEVDKEFSKLSVEKGANFAFGSYIDDDGVLLRRNNYPIVGKFEVNKYLGGNDDSGFTLSWDPLAANMSESGDMGFTYGTYEFRNKDTITMGTYVTIWKKDNEGNWKMALDSGNEGLGK